MYDFGACRECEFSSILYILECDDVEFTEGIDLDRAIFEDFSRCMKLGKKEYEDFIIADYMIEYTTTLIFPLQFLSTHEPECLIYSLFITQPTLIHVEFVLQVL